MNPASASSPWAGRIAASATSSRSASSSESPAASSGAAAEPVADLQGGRRLGQRPRHRVDLAALQRHRPAAGRAPRRELVDPAVGQGGAVDDGVGEEVARHPQREHERPRRRPEVGLDLGERRAPGQPRRDPRASRRGRARRRRAGGRRCSRSRNADGGPGRRTRANCSRVRVVVGTTCARSASAAARPPSRSCRTAARPRRSRRTAAGASRVGRRSEGVRRVDQRAVEVGADDRADDHPARTARPSAPVAPRVNRGWISPTQL